LLPFNGRRVMMPAGRRTRIAETERMKVLVVEDSLDFRGRILKLLRPLPGVEVVGVASTNAEAIALCAALRPDVVTLDVSLRDGSSLRTLHRMMAAEPQPVVIVLTDHSQPHYRQRYLEAGAKYFVAKSDLEKLPEVIHENLDDE
jgi:pilus assembly protein CpaE